MSAFYNLDQPHFNSRSFARAIAAANNGLLFDIGDMSTLYQDYAGTVPVTAVGQPVGKILDKSGNGYHATQSVTASRPTLSARYNLLTKTEDFSDAVWVRNSVSTTTSKYLSPIGTFTANKVTLASGAAATGNDGVGAFASPLITANGSAYTLSLFAKSAGSNYIRFREAANTGQRVKISLIDGSFAGEAGWVPSTFTVSVTPAPNGFFLIQITRSAPTTFSFNIKCGDDVGDGVNGIYVWGIDLRLSTTPGPYQRVNTATDYDTNPALFPPYLKFDGVDDYLNLPFMNLYGGGAASIIAARDAVSQATDTYIISERSTSNANQKYFPSRQLASGKNMDSYISDDTAAVVLDTTGSAFSGASDKVIRSVVDTGNNIKLFKNGALAANDNYTRAGTLTLNKTTIGASVSTTTSNYASMKLYGLIITKSALNDAQRVRCERFLARKSGVML